MTNRNVDTMEEDRSVSHAFRDFCLKYGVLAAGVFSVGIILIILREYNAINDIAFLFGLLTLVAISLIAHMLTNKNSEKISKKS